MTVVFKSLKYKHYRRAMELQADPNTTEDEHMAYVMSLVQGWDFVDAETDEAIPAGQPDELSFEQYKEVMNAFNARFTKENEIPNARA